MSSTQNNCKFDHDNFCFVCGVYSFGVKYRNIDTVKFQECYKKVFKLEVKDRIVDWSPSVVCNNCHRRVLDNARPISFGSPMLWNIPANHPIDCYFCNIVFETGARRDRPEKVKYPPGTSAIPPTFVQQQQQDQQQQQPQQQSSAEGECSGTNSGDASGAHATHAAHAIEYDEEMVNVEMLDDDESMQEIVPSEVLSETSYQPASSGEIFKAPKHYPALQPPPLPKKKIKMDQLVLADLVRDINLPKEDAELLASRLQDLLEEEGKFKEKCSTFLQKKNGIDYRLYFFNSRYQRKIF